MKDSAVLNVAEITTHDWDGLRILHPYETRTLGGEKFTQNKDSVCLWVFLNDNQVVDSFEIARETVDCIDLPTETFTTSDAIFLVRSGKLKMREKFQLPGK